MLQAGPKTQPGGVKTGLLRFAYQVGIAAVVKAEPIPPARKGSVIDSRNLKTLDITHLL